jgi:hypothetical protein
MVRANVPMTAAPLGDGRPVLGGSPNQIAADLRHVEKLDVDQVFFSTQTPTSAEDDLRLLEQLQSTVGSA